jgi:hypothetical protein
MSKFSKALRDFLVFDDTEYVYPHNVVHLNTPHARAHARANAEQAMLLDKAEREQIQRDEIDALLEELYAKRRQLEGEIFDLENERRRLQEVPRG